MILSVGEPVTAWLSCAPKPPDSRVQTLFEIYEGIARPQIFLQLFACNYCAGSLDQDGQNGQRLAFQPDTDALLAQLAALRIEFKGTETVQA